MKQPQSKKSWFILILSIITVLTIYKIKTIQSQPDKHTILIKKGKITESIYGIGTVTASKSLDLKTGVTSTIKNIFVKEGDFVMTGQRLVELDLGTVLSAPFSGTITALPVKTGETIFQQSTILTLTNLTDRYLVVSLDQKGAVHVKENQTAKISFESLRNTTFEGQIESIYSNENNFLVRINVSNLPKEILPGMTADVAISISEKDNVLLIPLSAILNNQINIIDKKGKNQTVSIKLGLVDSTMAEVISGNISEGDKVILDTPKK